jgi:hypothetical protein
MARSASLFGKSPVLLPTPSLQKKNSWFEHALTYELDSSRQQMIRYQTL